MNVKHDTWVELRYRLFDEKGQLVESSDEDGEIRYRHGHEEILPGLERALDKAAPGDQLKVELDPEDAYGEYQPEGIVALPRDQLPDDSEYRPGDWVSVSAVTEDEEATDSELDEEIELRVVEVNVDTIFLDANHPLAGQRVTFEVEVVSVESAN